MDQKSWHKDLEDKLAQIDELVARRPLRLLDVMILVAAAAVYSLPFVVQSGWECSGSGASTR